MCVYISVGIERGEDVPIISLGQISDVRIIAGQELMQNKHDSCRRDPFSGMNATLDEDSRIICLKGKFDTLDLTSFICLAAYENLHLV